MDDQGGDKFAISMYGNWSERYLENAWAAFRKEIGYRMVQNRTVDDWLDLEISGLLEDLEPIRHHRVPEFRELEEDFFYDFVLEILGNLKPHPNFYPAINFYKDWDHLLKAFVRFAGVGWHPAETVEEREVQWAKIGKRLAFEKMEETALNYKRKHFTKPTRTKGELIESVAFKRLRAVTIIEHCMRKKDSSLKRLGPEKILSHIIEDRGLDCVIKKVPFDEKILRSKNKGLAKRHREKIDRHNELRQKLIDYAELNVTMDTIKGSIREARDRIKKHIHYIPKNSQDGLRVLNEIFHAAKRAEVEKQHQEWQALLEHFRANELKRTDRHEQLQKRIDQRLKESGISFKKRGGD